MPRYIVGKVKNEEKWKNFPTFSHYSVQLKMFDFTLNIRTYT